MALAAEAQAVATAEHGPLSPQRIDTCPLAALTMSFGMTNGLIRDGPFCIMIVCWLSNSLSPPIPEPIKTPQFSAGSAEKSIPESATAEIAARQRELREAIKMPRLLDAEPGRGVPIMHLAAEMDAKLGGVKERERAHAALTGAEGVPEPPEILTKRRDHPHAGNHDTACMCHSATDS